MENKIWVEVVYALPQKQWQYRLQVELGDTVAHVIKTSGLLQECPALQLEQLKIGIWGRQVTLDKSVEAEDRIEIYRPLLIDPKQARLNKVSQERRSERTRRSQPKVSGRK